MLNHLSGAPSADLRDYFSAYHFIDGDAEESTSFPIKAGPKAALVFFITGSFFMEAGGARTSFPATSLVGPVNSAYRVIFPAGLGIVVIAEFSETGCYEVLRERPGRVLNTCKDASSLVCLESLKGLERGDSREVAGLRERTTVLEEVLRGIVGNKKALSAGELLRIRTVKKAAARVKSGADRVNVADGSVLHVMTLGRDITARKIAEIELNKSYQEKTALLKEVHHRVKNNLQIVASLLGLQAGRSGSPQIEEVLRATRDRVRSMALLHEALYSSETLARIDFGYYLQNLCRQLLASSGPAVDRVRLDFRMEPIALPLEPALPCGLIVNELVSNALKHGFPNDSAGRILVGFEPLGERSLVLSVCNDGAGLPPGFDPASNATLGMRLVKGLVDQLNGELRVELPPEGGVCFRAVFPIPNDTKVGGET